MQRFISFFFSFLLVFFNTSVIFSQKNSLAKLTFVDLDKRKITLDLESVKDSLDIQSQRIYEPHMKEERKYIGFSLSKLLTKAFQNTWEKSDDVIFVCSDGYRAVVSVRRILEHKAYLAFAVEGESKFEIVNRLQKNEVIPVGPYYLVWENIEDKSMRDMGATGWPYQVVGIELSSFKENFGALLPKNRRLSKSEEAGFLAFRDHCLSCHKLNGVGGELSKVDLNHPVNPTEYWQRDFLIRYIQDPQSIKPWVNMPSLGSRQKAKDIYSYLARMSDYKTN